MSGDRGVRFAFGPRDRRALLAGLRTAQLTLLASGALAAVLLARSGGKATLAEAISPLLAAFLLGWLPIGGRTADQWLPVVARYLGSRRPPPFAGCGRQAPERRRRHVIGRGLELVAIEREGGTDTGAVLDRRSRTATAVVTVGASGVALLDDADRDRRVAAWAAALAGCTFGGGLHRLQWIERVERVIASPPREARPDLLSDRTRAAASYAALMRAERVQIEHRILLAVTVRTGAVGDGFAVADESTLLAELGGLESRLRDAGLAVEGRLSSRELGRLVRRTGEALPSDLVGSGQSFPELRRRAWTCVRVGALWHASYWVAEWPRQGVTSGFLLPLLLAGEDCRTLSVVMAPVPQQRAVRSAEQARTARSADAEFRQRHGFALTARSRGEDEAVLRREAELAAGHAAFRFSGYLTVSARDRSGLELAARRVAHVASLAHLELVRLDGAHEEGFCCTLPLGRGCR